MPKVGIPHIYMDQQAGQSHLRRYYVQQAMNCQPNYSWGSRKSSSYTLKLHFWNIVFTWCAYIIVGSGLSVCTATPFCKWQDIPIPHASF